LNVSDDQEKDFIIMLYIPMETRKNCLRLTELRDAWLLLTGISEKIEVQWLFFKEGGKGKEANDMADQSEGETNDGEGSEYDRDDYELRKRSKVNKKKKRKRKTFQQETNE
jgi:hypothetical protein